MYLCPDPNFDVFSACAELHMNKTGASDSFLFYPSGTEEKMIEYLKNKLLLWSPSPDFAKKYDDAVRELIISTLKERGINVEELYDAVG